MVVSGLGFEDPSVEPFLLF